MKKHVDWGWLGIVLVLHIPMMLGYALMAYFLINVVWGDNTATDLQIFGSITLMICGFFVPRMVLNHYHNGEEKKG